MRALFNRLLLFLLAGAFFVVFHYWGGVRREPSLLLAIAFSIIALCLFVLLQFAAFRPYRLIVGINYEALWEDLKLAPTNGPKFQNFAFTAISRQIYARSDDRNYSTQINLSVEVPCGEPTWEMTLDGFRRNPTFNFRSVRKGYQLSVSVQEDWWEAQKPHLASRLRELQLNYSDEIVLGYLPYGYIPEHVRLWNEPVSLLNRFDSKQRRWEEKLEKLGWSVKEHDPTRIMHRYLGIGYYEI